MDSLKNFQGYIQQATSLVAEAKLGIKLIKDLDVAVAESVMAGILSGYLTPVFALLGQFRSYIPTSIPSLPGTAGIGGLGNLSIPNCGLGSLNNNVINTVGITGL